MAQAIKAKGLSTTEKFIFLMICNYTDENGECYPSVDRLAEDCVVNERTVRRVIKSLCEKGYIRKTERFKNGVQTSNLYHVNPSKNGCVTESHHIDASQSRIEHTKANPSNFHPDTESGYPDTESEIGVTQSQGGGDTESPKPINESINRKKIYKKKKISISEFLEKEGEEELHQKCRDFALKKNYTKENFQKEYDRYKTHFQANNQKYQNWYLVFTKWVNNQYSMFSQGKHSSSQTQNMTARQKSDLRFQQEFEKRINGGSSIEPDTTSTIDITNYQPQEKKWN